MRRRVRLCRSWYGFLCVLLLLAAGASPAAAQRRVNGAGIPAGALPPPDLPVPTYEGNIRELSGTDMVLQLDKPADIVKLKCSNKTEVYKDAKKLKVAALSVGDRVLIVGSVDRYGFLEAKKVTFERAATPQETARVQTPLPQPPPEADKTTSLSDDSGRPTLRRRTSGSSDSSSTDSTGSNPADSSSADSEPTLRRRAPSPTASGNSGSTNSDSPASGTSNSTDSSSSPNP